MKRTPGQSLMARASEYHKAGRYKRAEQLYRELLKRNPKDGTVLHLLAMVNRDLGKPQKAIQYFRKAIKIDSSNANLWADLGLLCAAVGDIDDGVEALTKALEIDPDRADLYFHLGRLNAARSMMNESVDALLRAVKLAPDRLEYREFLVGAINSSGRLPIDTSYAEKLVEADLQNAEYINHLATAHRLNGDFDQAETCYMRALELDRQLPAAVAGLAELRESTGDSVGAFELLQKLVDSGQVTTLVALAYARVCKRLEKQENAIPVLNAAIGRKDISPYHRSSLNSSLGKALEDTGDYDRAFDCYAKANKVHAGRWNQVDDVRSVDAIIEAFSADQLASLPRAQNDAQIPVFILGMFRSGTTLIETILSSHPQVYGAGERTNLMHIAATMQDNLGTETGFPSCIAHLTQEAVDGFADQYLKAIRALAPEAQRITDKLPPNYRLLGLIQLLFPGGRVIHCRRDPLDTCFSCYANQFTGAHAYTSDFSDLAVAYQQYRKLMDHWNGILDLPILEVHYEELVADQEQVTRNIIDFCDLPWDDACLRFHESDRVAQTPSVDQVRTKMYSSSVGRAKHFERHLTSLRKALTPWLETTDKRIS